MGQLTTPNGVMVRPEPGLPAERLEQLQRDGFCVIPDVAGEAVLDLTRRCVERAVAAQNAERLALTRSPGTLIDSDRLSGAGRHRRQPVGRCTSWSGWA